MRWLTFDIDRDVCQAYGVCAGAAPDHVELDADGEPVPKGIQFSTVPPDVEQAVRSCPSRAALVRDQGRED